MSQVMTALVPGRSIGIGVGGAVRPGRLSGRTGKQTSGLVRAYAPVQEDAVIARGAELGIEFKPLHKNFGVDVVNMDIEKGLSEAEGGLLKEALDCFELVRFRGYKPSPEKQVEMMRFLPHDEESFDRRDELFSFAQYEHHPWLMHRKANMEDEHSISNETLDPSERPKLSLFRDARAWHMDNDWKPCPPEYSMIHAEVVPPTGGQTVFASTRKAYEMLSDEQKAQAEQLNTKMRPWSVYFIPPTQGFLSTKENGIEWMDETIAKIEESLKPEEQVYKIGHPLVVVDPDTGHKSLFLTPYQLRNFVGMGFEESQALMKEYFLPAVAEENVWSSEWEVGDVVVWKNRQILHSTTPKKHWENMEREIHVCFWLSDRPVEGVQTQTIHDE